MRLTYSAPTMEVKEFARFENVFTWCSKVSGKSSDIPADSPHYTGGVCINVTGTDNDSDKPGDLHPSYSNAHKGGGGGLGS